MQPRHPVSAAPHVVVVGGGLAGLTAATLLGRAGVRVTVCERAGDLGGRAATHVREGYHLNLGPHALYLGNAAARELAALGLPLAGATPPGGWALRAGKLHMLPTGAVSLLSTGLFSFSAKRRAAAWLARLGRIEVAPLARVPLGRWLDEAAAGDASLRDFYAAVFRVSTYCTDPSMSTAAALAQLKSAVDTGVRYLDGGWQTIIDGLEAAARAAHATILRQASVSAIDDSDASGRRAVHLGDGRALPADAVLLCVGPTVAAALLPSSAALADAARAARPVRAACLDLALSALPRPRARLALGMDVPLYFSVHSATARLAPGDGAVIHAARYLDGSAADDRAEADLEALCDLMQPGWRDHVVERRFLPRMTVANDIPRADAGGLVGRAPITVADALGVWVAGDWVGPEGLLADAVVASAVAAARAIAQSRRVAARPGGTQEVAA